MQANSCSVFRLAVILIISILTTSTESKLVVKPVATNQTHALRIGVQFIVDDVSAVRVLEQDFRLDYYMILNWTIDSVTCMRDLGKLIKAKGRASLPAIDEEVILMGDQISKFFWTPDVFAVDAKKVESPNTKPLLRIQIKDKTSADDWGMETEGKVPYNDHDEDVVPVNPVTNPTSAAKDTFCTFRYETRYFLSLFKC